jgi:hypothetical protein
MILYNLIAIIAIIAIELTVIIISKNINYILLSIILRKCYN